MGYVIPPMCSWSAPVSPSNLMCPKNLKGMPQQADARTTSRGFLWHKKSTDCTDTRCLSSLPYVKGSLRPSNPAKQTHFSRLHPQWHFFRSLPYDHDHSWGLECTVEWLVNRELRLHHNSCQHYCCLCVGLSISSSILPSLVSPITPLL